MSDPINKLVTRDPQAMKHTLEDAEYAGSDAVENLDSGLIEVRAGNASGMQAVPVDPAASNNINPGYTPPGQQVTPHSHEGAADLPEGSPAEAGLERDGQNR